MAAFCHKSGSAAAGSAFEAMLPSIVGQGLIDAHAGRRYGPKPCTDSVDSQWQTRSRRVLIAGGAGNPRVATYVEEP